MDSIHFSISQHLLHPFSLHNQKGEEISHLQLREKIQVIALAIIAGIATLVLASGLGAGFISIGVFYILTAYHKIQFISTYITPPKESLKNNQLSDFFNSILKPTLNEVSAKASNAKMCLIKNDTALFSDWLQIEYKFDQESFQKNNLLYLRETYPEVSQGLFVSIRGDGDCTLRSIGSGLILQVLLTESNFIETLLNQLGEAEKILRPQVADLNKKIGEIEDDLTELGKQIKQEEEQLVQQANHYRTIDGLLNEEGQKLKATSDEKRDIACILESHLIALKNEINQKAIREQLKKLDSSYQGICVLVQHLKEFKMPLEKAKKMIELMEGEEFDQYFITFLRSSSAINSILNLSKLGSYIKQLSHQEQVMAGELSIFDLLMHRAKARQPDHEYLQGSINDAISLSMLFNQPISWYRCEVAYEPKDRTIYHFGQEYLNSQKKQLYILNRPGHSDLILV